MVDDIIGGMLGAALAPGGKFSEWLAMLLCFAAAVFSLGFGVWFAFVGIEAVPLAIRFGIAFLFLPIVLVRFWHVTQIKTCIFTEGLG
ncbi:hypothetical protein HPT27_03445 [Permianibacter sp. IMCC34836]|uniref:hypothetical protein n=1 Tax=Permianibacter fluminis TaxID=2738515 RepID=UPI001557091C|nr:hypothetical protein [Permianibacter fluminis]NQD36064.1 hypothetical protein [Permianibacter fluminis]